MRKDNQVRFPIIKIFLIAFVFFIIGIFSSTFIVIFITPHKKEVYVPNLIGKNYTQALTILKERDLKFKLIFKHSNTVTKNHIISQLPSPKERVRIGRCIELNISQGPILVEVPDITNLTLLKAESILAKVNKGNTKGLKIGEVAYVYSPYVEKNIIIAHNPTCGRKVPKGSFVNILVSLGPEKPTLFMPDLTGLRSQEAISSLEKIGLILQKVEYKTNEDIKDDIVLEHIPCANSKVSKRDLVTLTVNTKENKKELEYRSVLICYKVPDGFYNCQVRILIVDQQGQREIFNEKKTPGSKIELTAYIIGDAKASIYLNDILKEEKQL